MKRLPIVELGIAIVVAMLVGLAYINNTSVSKITEETQLLVEDVVITDACGDIENVDGTSHIVRTIEPGETGEISTVHFKYYLISYRLPVIEQPSSDLYNESVSYIRVEREDTLVEPSLHNTPYYIEPYSGKEVPPEAKARSPGIVGYTALLDN